MKVICDICKKEFDAPNKKSHICKECQQKKDKCPICGKEKSIFAKTCSKSCGMKLAHLNKKQTTLRKEVQEDVRKTRNLDGLKELVDAGVYDDFEEIPVSFEEFITNREYLGNSWLDSNGNLKAFPFWVKQEKKVFPLPMRSPYHTILLEGGTGLGKTSFAVCMVIAYYLHIVLCLRDPHEYFDLADQKKITFAFLNIVTKTIAYKNAWGMFHKALLSSHWFMKHGASTGGRIPEWYCVDKPIDVVYGSSASAFIGLDVLCLTGDTKIWHEDGTWKTLESLENKKLQLYNYNATEKYIALSDVCEVKKTKETQDLIEIITEDGSSIKCTPEHRFLLKTGQYKLAKDLTEEDELEDGEDI